MYGPDLHILERWPAEAERGELMCIISTAGGGWRSGGGCQGWRLVKDAVLNLFPVK